MSIQTTISMQNQVSSVLSSIVGSMNMVIASAYEVQNSTGNMIDTSSLEIAKRSIADASVGINHMSKEQIELNDNIKTSNTLFDGLKGKIIGVVGAYAGFQGVKKLVEISDGMAQIDGRLNLIKSKEESIESINQKIYLSAKNARAEYFATADAVAKLGTTAKDAFSGTDEIIQFTELLNKNLKIGGATAEEQKSAMYQLTQAMSSGRLQGDEFRSIIENAPLLAQAISDTMGLSMAELKKASSEGQITSDIIKKALFESADDINNKFAQIPMTFSDIKNSVINDFIMQLKPALKNLNEFMNSSSFQTFVANISNSFGFLATIIGFTIELFITGFNNMAGIIDTVKYPLLGLIAVVALYNAILFAQSTLHALKTAEIGAMTIAQKLYALATGQATLAQIGLNTALLTSPVFLIPAILIMIIALIFGVVQWINKAQGTTTSAVGVICGVINVGIAFIINLFIGLANAGITTVETIQNGFISFAEFLLNVFNNPVASIITLFSNMANTVLGILKSIASAIDGVFGSNLALAIGGWQDSVTGFADKLKPDDYTTLERKQYDRIERVDYADAYNVGYKWGADKEKAIKNKFTSLTNPNQLSDQNALATKLGDSIKDKDLKDKVNKIADSTNGIDKKLDKVDWENNNLDSLKGLMETRAINDLSKSVKLNVHNEFTGPISNDVDVDEVADRATRKIMNDLELATNAG